MSLQVIGPPSPGSKVVLWAESRLPRQTWSIDELGHICSQMFQGQILDVKGNMASVHGRGRLWGLRALLSPALFNHISTPYLFLGGRGYDRDHVVLWELAEDRASQIWTIHVL